MVMMVVMMMTVVMVVVEMMVMVIEMMVVMVVTVMVVVVRMVVMVMMVMVIEMMVMVMVVMVMMVMEMTVMVVMVVVVMVMEMMVMGVMGVVVVLMVTLILCFTLPLTECLPLCPQILGYFDIAFTSVFTVEIILKVSEGRGKASAWAWGVSGSGNQTRNSSNVLTCHSLGLDGKVREKREGGERLGKSQKPGDQKGFRLTAGVRAERVDSRRRQATQLTCSPHASQPHRRVCAEPRVSSPH